MADQTEEVILKLEVDAGAAEKDLAKVEKSIIGTKAAMQDLSKAYKAGTITQDEFIDESIRLQAIQKKEQEQKRTLIQTINTESNSRNALKLRVSQLTKEYDNLNRSTATGAKRADELEKELAQLNAQITKTSKSAGLFKDQIGNYPHQLAEAAKSINVAGVSVGDLATKFSTFAGGATAVVGALSAVAGAYASSASGARDLENAQLLLSKSYELAGEGLAQFVNSGEDQKGIIEGLTTAILVRYVPGIYAISEAYASAARNLKDLEISRAFAAGDAKNDERRAEILRRIRDDESQIIDDRIAASAKIDEILETSKQRTVIILKAEADAIRKSTVGYDKSREAQLAVAQLTAEIADKEEEITGKLTENVTARRTLIKLQQDELFLLEQEIRDANKPTVNLGAAAPGGGALVNQKQGDQANLKDPIIDASKARQDQFIAELKTVEFTEDQKRQYYAASLAIKQQIDQAEFDSAEALLGGLTALAKEGSSEQKALALINIGVNTAEALTSGIASSQDIPYPGNLFAMASTIATILANIAAAKQYIGFAAGGYTGPGYGSPDSSGFKPAGIVHEHEYVTPKRVVFMPQAQHHLNALESLRTRGYADGGLVANSVSSDASIARITADAIENMPPAEVSVKEITLAQKRIKARENTTTLAR